MHNEDLPRGRRRSLRLSPELDAEMERFFEKASGAGVQIFTSELVAIAVRELMQRDDAIDVIRKVRAQEPQRKNKIVHRQGLESPNQID